MTVEFGAGFAGLPAADVHEYIVPILESAYAVTMAHRAMQKNLEEALSSNPIVLVEAGETLHISLEQMAELVESASSFLQARGN